MRSFSCGCKREDSKDQRAKKRAKVFWRLCTTHDKLLLKELVEVDL